MQGAGYLAIWSDLAPQDHTDWAHWITREHAAERVGVNGFLACRIFRALGASVNRYFILYELEDERVVGGPDYLARLNAPTPWSQSIMPRLGNFARGGGRIAASAGTGQGGIVAPLRLDAAPSWDAATVAADLARLDRIIAVRVLLTDIAQTSIKTREKGMRSNDGSFAALLLIEGLDEAAVRDALHHLRKTLTADDEGAIDDLPLYRLAFSLPKQLLAGLTEAVKQIVVPANSRDPYRVTSRLKNEWQMNCPYAISRRGVWVPAFAGTTTRNCPTGKSTKLAVHPFAQKYSALAVGQISGINLRVLTA